jgi:chromosomal replication initiator protein
MDENLKRIWGEIANGIRPHVSTDAFQRWFASIELVNTDEMSLTLLVPNTIYQLWIESNYAHLVQAATLAVLGSTREVKFRISENGKQPAAAEPLLQQPAQNGAAEKGPEPSTNHGMNPRNTFETFVVGSNNQFAHAAALAVAQSPAKTYNPLFIYGGVGLGKTHLMQAVGQQVVDRKKAFKVMYLSSERFTNEFIDASTICLKDSPKRQ